MMLKNLAERAKEVGKGAGLGAIPLLPALLWGYQEIHALTEEVAESRGIRLDLEHRLQTQERDLGRMTDFFWDYLRKAAVGEAGGIAGGGAEQPTPPPSVVPSGFEDFRAEQHAKVRGN